MQQEFGDAATLKQYAETRGGRMITAKENPPASNRGEIKKFMCADNTRPDCSRTLFEWFKRSMKNRRDAELRSVPLRNGYRDPNGLRTDGRGK